MKKIIQKILGIAGVKTLEQLTDEFLRLDKSENDLLKKISLMASTYMERTAEYNEHKKGENLSVAADKYNEFSKAHLIEVVEIKNDLENIRNRKKEIITKKPEIQKAFTEYNKRKKISVIKRKYEDGVISGETMTQIIKAGIGPVRTIILLVCNHEGKHLVFHNKKTNTCYLPYGFLFEKEDEFNDINQILKDSTGLQAERITGEKLFKKDNFLRQYYHIIPVDSQVITNGDLYDSFEWKSIPELISDSRLQEQYKADLKALFPFLETASVALTKAAENGLLEKVLPVIEKSWSSDLLKKHPGSQWITMRGSRVLIRGGADGKAKIIFAGDSALEHLELDMTKKKVEKLIDPKEKEAEKERSERKKEAKQALRETLKQNINRILGGDDFKANKKPELKQKIENLNPKERKELNEHLEKLSKKKVIESNINQVVGGDAVEEIFGKKPIIEPNKKIQEIMDGLNLTPEQHLEILSEMQDAKEKSKALDKMFKSEIGEQKEISKKISDILKGEKISNEDATQKAIEEELAQKAAEERIALNNSFYNQLDEYKEKKTVDKNLVDGATNAINSIADILGENVKISRNSVKFLGAKNAAILMGSQLNPEDASKLKQHLENEVQKNIKNHLDSVAKTQEYISDLKKEVATGTIYQANIGLTTAKYYKQAYEELGNLAGEVHASAEVYNALTEKNQVVIEAGKDFEDIKKKANNLGIKDEDINYTQDNQGNYNIVVEPKNFKKLIRSFQDGYKRDEFVKKAKSGGLVEKDWKPEFANEFVDGKKAYAMPAQQEGVKWATHQKKSILNFGAGLGKTYTYMGIISELKSKGEMKDNFAVIAVPSRLRKEFYKDKEKFYSGMKMANLDDLDNTTPLYKRKEFFPDIEESKLKTMSGHDLKEELINRAKKGEYDFLLTGHDTVKNKQTVDLIAKHKPKAVIVDEAHEAISSSTGSSDREDAIRSMTQNADYVTMGTGTLVRNSMKELGKIVQIVDPSKVDAVKKASDFERNINKESSLYLDNSINKFNEEYDDLILSRTADLSYIDNEGNVKKPEIKYNKVKTELTGTQKKRYSDIEKAYEQERKNKGKFGLFDKETNSFVFGGDGNLIVNDKQKGIEITDKKRYSVKQMGDVDSQMRRDLNHKRNLYAGNHSENGKAIALADNIRNLDGKHVVYYDTMVTKDAKQTLTDTMIQNLGLKPDQVKFIDGSVKIGKERNQQLQEFNDNPDAKVILINSAGATGLNMQGGKHVHFFSAPNTYAEEEQTSKRVYRTGQKKDVEVHYYDTNVPYEKSRRDNIERKKRITRAIGEYVEQ